MSERGDYAGAVALYEESLAVSRRIGASWAAACALHNLGLMADHMDDLERAAILLGEALPHWDRLGDEVSRARTLDAAALVARRRGDLDRALALGRGRPEAAARLLGAADAIDGAGGAVRPPVLQRRHERLAADVAASLAEDAFATAWAAGRALSPEDAVTLALAEGYVP